MKIGFIGCGNMASSMINGLLGSKAASPDELMASAKTEKTRAKIRDDFHIKCGTNQETAAFADVLVLAVKPQFYEEVIRDTKDYVKPGICVISIAPGKTLDWLSGKFDGKVNVIRMMPNTPALIGQGMTGICCSENVTETQRSFAVRICESFGKCLMIPERLMDVVTGISGSSPAYVYMMIEAMADAAVAEGMPRQDAYVFAAQAVAGSANMVLQSGEHPGVLKDKVCSPGGTTIEAVAALEKNGFRSALIEAVRECVRKSRNM